MGQMIPVNAPPMTHADQVDTQFIMTHGKKVGAGSGLGTLFKESSMSGYFGVAIEVVDPNNAGDRGLLLWIPGGQLQDFKQHGRDVLLPDGSYRRVE